VVRKSHSFAFISLLATLKDEAVGPSLIADFVLYHLNLDENYSYVEEMGLRKGPTDDLKTLCADAAMARPKARTMDVKDPVKGTASSRTKRQTCCS